MIDDKIYKIAQDVYCIQWINLMHFNAATMWRFGIDPLVDQKYSNIFPYNPLNIDSVNAFVFKEGKYWVILTNDNFNNNLGTKCQQGTLQKYIIRKKKDNSLVLYPALFNRSISNTIDLDNITRTAKDNYMEKFYEYQNMLKAIKNDINGVNDGIIQVGTKMDDEILTILFLSKLHYYNFNDVKKDKYGNYYFDLTCIDYIFNDNKLEISYNENTLHYDRIDEGSWCCGSGLFTFLLSNEMTKIE